MKLYKGPFKKIRLSEKKIEIRLFDEKRRKLNIGDRITFSKLPDLNEQLSVEIIGLLQYSSFRGLVDDFPMSYFGYPENYDKIHFVESIYQIYTREDEQKYGVLGIRMRLI